MCMLQSFFCFELQTAGVILGWMATVKSLLYLITTSVSYQYLPNYINQTLNDLNNITNQTSEETFVETSATIVQGLAVAFIALTAIDFIASVLLLIGTIQGKRLLLLPWLIENGFQLLYTILGAAIVLIALMSTDKGIDAAFGIFLAIVIGIPLFFSLYCWSAVYSLYHWLGEVDTQRARLLGTSTTGKAYYPAYQTYERV